MDKMNEIAASPLDVFLFPVWVHKKLSIKLKSLIFAFLFVGLFDMFFYENVLTAYFGGSVPELLLRLFVFLLLSLVIGAIDVICVMVPIAEFAVMIGKRSEKYVHKKLPVILMKSYALSHLLFVLPKAFEVYSGVAWENVDVNSSTQIRLILSILVVLANFLPFFQLGILYRTISVRTRLQVFGKLALIFAAYFWMGISGGAIYFFEILFQGLLKSMF